MMLAKKSFRLAGHATSIALEPEFWTVLEQHAASKGLTLPQLVAAIDQNRAGNNLASALRVAALQARQLG
jgi:predicted DNA-binding ribbon-helix-helix protein